MGSDERCQAKISVFDWGGQLKASASECLSLSVCMCLYTSKVKRDLVHGNEEERVDGACGCCWLFKEYSDRYDLIQVLLQERLTSTSFLIHFIWGEHTCLV